MSSLTRCRLVLNKECSVYHVISRTIGSQFLFKDTEKEVFRKMLWRQLRFSGIELLSYCIMSNHFHILIRVKPENDLIEDSEILKRYREYYKRESLSPYTVKPHDLERIFAKGGKDAEQLRAKIIKRMNNLSAFIAELKHNFSIWYNKKHSNHGTIWSSRFKSLLIENNPRVLQILCNYITLNPVRAKIVENPADYRFCLYAEALSGRHRAQCAMMQVTATNDWKSCIYIYNLSLSRKTKHEDIATRRSIDDNAFTDHKINLSLPEALRYKWRYFTAGLIIGNQIYIESIFVNNRKYFSIKRRKISHKMKGAKWEELSVYRSIKI